MPSQVRNRTKYKLRLDGAEQQQVLLAPFEQRTLSDDEFESFNETQMTRHALVGVEEVPTAERVSSVRSASGCSGRQEWLSHTRARSCSARAFSVTSVIAESPSGARRSVRTFSRTASPLERLGL